MLVPVTDVGQCIGPEAEFDTTLTNCLRSQSRMGNAPASRLARHARRRRRTDNQWQDQVPFEAELLSSGCQSGLARHGRDP